MKTPTEARAWLLGRIQEIAEDPGPREMRPRGGGPYNVRFDVAAAALARHPDFTPGERAKEFPTFNNNMRWVARLPRHLEKGLHACPAPFYSGASMPKALFDLFIRYPRATARTLHLYHELTK